MSKIAAELRDALLEIAEVVEQFHAGNVSDDYVVGWIEAVLKRVGFQQ